MEYFIHANLVLENGILYDGTLATEDGRIAALGEDIPIPAGAVVRDVKGAYIGPGFVDIHCHGGNGYNFDEKPAEAAEHFLRHGETTMLATLYHNLSYPDMLAAIRRVRDAMTAEDTNLAGIYMEGPYMNPVYGAEVSKNQWRGEIDMEKAEALIDAGGEAVKIWTVAPEREGVPEFARLVHEKTPSAVLSFGHTEATVRQIMALRRYGLRDMTHFADATGHQAAPTGTITPGPNEAALYEPDFYTEIICDSLGIHVQPDMLRLVCRVKGEDRVILITDSTCGLDEDPVHGQKAVDLLFDEEGRINGSRMTMEQACRNLMHHTSCGICQAFRMGALNPARLIGMDGEIGSLEVGKRANLVVTDDWFHIQSVFLNGKAVKGV